MSTYVKLFGSLLDSTVWAESAPTKVVWITLLAMSDRDGLVEASIPGLAKRAGVSREDCEKALKVFLAPDSDSRTKDHAGRRIREVEGGWFVLNYEKYRDKATAEEARLKNADRQRRWRERNGHRNAHVTPVTQNNVLSSSSSSSSSSSKDGSSSPPVKKYPSEAFKAMKLIEADIRDIKESGSDSKWRDRAGALTEAGKTDLKRLRDLLAKNKEIACR